VPAHHPRSIAARVVFEGVSACATAGGAKCAMRRGDLIRTPTGPWKEHGHDGDKPVVRDMMATPGRNP
jgi:gentisate 1,2-dioxygenase